MAEEKRPIFKSDAAKEAFAQLLQIAGMDRDRLLMEIAENKGYSEYERVSLKMQVAQSYQSMVAKAYETAMEVEAKAMIMSAHVACIAGQ